MTVVIAASSISQAFARLVGAVKLVLFVGTKHENANAVEKRLANSDFELTTADMDVC